MARWIFQCFDCGQTQPMDDHQVYRSDTCPSCDADMRCCLNCRHYERGAPNDCRETVAEFVPNKERANYCDFFQARQKDPKAGEGEASGGGGAGESTGRSAADEARAKLEALFKK